MIIVVIIPDQTRLLWTCIGFLAIAQVWKDMKDYRKVVAELLLFAVMVIVIGHALWGWV